MTQETKPRVLVWIRCQFEGIHYWPDAPDTPVGRLLKVPHRHIFHVKLAKEAGHVNRDIEFIQLKQDVERYCTKQFSVVAVPVGTSFSCEYMAQELLAAFGAAYAEVSEDGENGAAILEPLRVDVLDILNDRETALKKWVIDTIQKSRGWKDMAVPPPSGPTYHGNRGEATVDASNVPTLRRNAVPHHELPSSKIRYNCFYGNEAEGPHRGELVLFAPGCITAARLHKAYHWMVEQGLTPQRIYLGAGNLPYPMEDTVLMAATLTMDDRNVDIEIDTINRLYTLHKGGQPFTWISRNKDDAEKATFVKSFGVNEVAWICHANDVTKAMVYQTLLNDPLFAQDKDIPV
jgi:hypothetical protein